MLVIFSHYSRGKKVQISYDHTVPKSTNIDNVIKIYRYIKYYRQYSVTYYTGISIFLN